jgi:hypothetical protein
MTAPSRRDLRFQDLDEVVRDAETLHAGVDTRAGQWNLAQACGHLARWLRYPVEGYPPAPLLMRLMLAVLRYTVAPGMIRRMLATGAMDAGRPTFRDTVPPAGGDEAAAVDGLRRAVALFRDHPGPYAPSPLFGTLDRDTAARLQLIHCAHHLSFLVPRPESPAGR